VYGVSNPAAERPHCRNMGIRLALQPALEHLLPLLPPSRAVAVAVLVEPAVMLKITLHDSSRELRFRLEGRLSGAWVAELRQCWLTAQSTIRGRTTTLDLSEVDYVDRDGQSLLKEMHQQGVVLKAVTPLIRQVVREIESAGRCVTVEEAPAPRSDALVSSDQTARHRRAL